MTLFKPSPEHIIVTDEFPIGIVEGVNNRGEVMELPPLSPDDIARRQKIEAELRSLGTVALE